MGLRDAQQLRVRCRPDRVELVWGRGSTPRLDSRAGLTTDARQDWRRSRQPILFSVPAIVVNVVDLKVVRSLGFPNSTVSLEGQGTRFVRDGQVVEAIPDQRAHPLVLSCVEGPTQGCCAGQSSSNGLGATRGEPAGPEGYTDMG